MIVVLAGGVGAARFLQGLVQVVPQNHITVIGNTGDDREFYGLHVSPDLDIVTYTLAGVVDEKQGWGLDNDTYNTMSQLTRYGNEDWFMLGDRDLATHIHCTNPPGKDAQRSYRRSMQAVRPGHTAFAYERSACGNSYTYPRRATPLPGIHGSTPLRRRSTGGYFCWG